MTPGYRAYVLRAIHDWALATKQGLGLITYRSSAIRQEIIQNLSQSLTQANWTTQSIQASAMDANQLLAAIAASTANLIHILDSEEFLFPLANQPQRFWINFNREAITGHPAIQIWWFTPAGATSLAQDLTDLNRFFLFREDLTEQDALLPSEDVPTSNTEIRIAKDAPVAQLLLTRTRRAIAAQAPAQRIWEELALPAISELLKAKRTQEAWGNLQEFSNAIGEPDFDLRPESLKILGELNRRSADPRNPSLHLHHAMTLFQAALSSLTENLNSSLWADLHQSLGTTYLQFPTGNLANNLQAAIAHFQSALRIHTEANFPKDWATAQNRLGAAFSQLPTGDRAANVQSAIAHYQAALRIRTEAQFPKEWAATQHNLGAAYAELPTGDRAANLRSAIDHFQAALRIRTEAQFPLEWASTQSNLGNVYSKLATGDRAENLQSAIAHYRNALKIWTPTAFPHNNKIAELNLHLAHISLAELSPDTPTSITN